MLQFVNAYAKLLLIKKSVYKNIDKSDLSKEK